MTEIGTHRPQPVHLAFLVVLVVFMALSGVPVGRAGTSIHASGGHATRPQWVPVSPSNPVAPSPRQQYGMAYDPLLQELVLFGGADPGGAPLGDTWTNLNGNWTEATTPTAPTARAAVGLAYDAALGGVVLFGGEGLSTFYNDTWLFNSSGWHQLTPAHHPPPMESINLVADSSAGYPVLLGTLPSTHDQVFWEFVLNDWYNATGVAGGLPPEVWENLADDPAVHGVVFYGGGNGCGDPSGGLSQTWVLAANHWTNVTRNQSVVPADSISSLAMGYDSGLNGVVMFSGYSLDCETTNATYLFANGEWSNLTSSVGVPPPPRWNSRLTYLPGVGDVIFSGNEGPNSGLPLFTNDTWALTELVIPSVTASFSYTTDHLRVNVTDTSSTVGSPLSVSLFLSWGDGTNTSPTSALDRTFNHTYSTAGTYHVTEFVVWRNSTGIELSNYSVGITISSGGGSSGGGSNGSGGGSVDWSWLLIGVLIGVGGGGAAAGAMLMRRPHQPSET